ncbi:BglG family transcription antiterminator [Streptococcus pacificus]|uniref:Ascorbate-specific PTS system EIIA component n=1 Tax=Streptococcus pacificus TaxID=2740577 RepID=A0ABS0ZIM2_9STRE|nr:BglG family transcription antiterminator [Streptococcus pacificus]MBJ8325839.1 BglG family transcription antiterminator [Streptococcus pacificus]
MLTNDIVKKLPLFSKYHGYPLSDLEGVLGVSRKSILSDMAKINATLEILDTPVISLVNDRINCPQISVTDLFVRLSPDLKDYLFQEERPYMIVLYLLLKEDYISNFHLQDVLRISKNTVLNDLKELKKSLRQKQVTIEYERKSGYFLVGCPKDLRFVLEWAINELLQFSSGKWIIRYLFHACQKPFEFDHIAQVFLTYTNQSQLLFINERIEATSYVILCLIWGRLEGKVVYSEQERQLISEIVVFELAKQFVAEFPNLKRECYFIATRLMGCTQGDIVKSPQPEILVIMEAIIDMVSAKTGIVFTNDAQFRQNLYCHLAPAYYRLLFDNHIVNPLKEHILSEYESLFYLIKKSLFPLSEALGKTISDDEVAYFTMHFGGYLTIHPLNNDQRKIVALAVCPNGISSSLILGSELQMMFPEFMFKDVHQLAHLNALQLQDYDVIFSTVFFETDKPLFVVQPFMNPVEKTILKKTVYNEFSITPSFYPKSEELLKLIKKSCLIEDEQTLREDLATYFLSLGHHDTSSWEGVSLTDLLTIDLIQTKENVKDWQEAITLAADPLLKQGYIEASYITAMIESVKTIGAYIVLAPHVAVPHATPEKGVKRLGMSLLHLKEPVSFNLDKNDFDDEREVQLIFVLAAIDSSAHLKALQELVMILDDEEKLQKLIAAETKEDIYRLLKWSSLNEEVE